MPSWETIAARPTPCLRCATEVRLAGPLDAATLADVRALLRSGRPVEAIRLIRQRTAASLPAAKKTYEHVTLRKGHCRQCNTPLTGELLCDCAACDALNIDA